METNPTPVKPAANRNLIIGVILAIVLCCCLVITAVAGYYGYQAYVQAQEAVETLQNFEIPTGLPSDISGDVPKGGLADDNTRFSAWLSLQVVGIISGCETPTAEGTTISVVQEPDSNGEWVEEWNVNCGNGTSQPFKVTFTPENGIVNVNVELP